MRAEKPLPGRVLTDTERKLLDAAVSGKSLGKVEIKILAAMWDRLGYNLPKANCFCNGHQRQAFLAEILPEMEKHVMADDWEIQKSAAENDQRNAG